MSYQVVDVSNWQVISQEPGGAESKDWITPRGSILSYSRKDWWLFKPVKTGQRLKAGGRPGLYRRYDDIAERVAAELAGLLELPAAEVQLAQNGSLHGIISRNVTPDGWTMQGGDILLSVLPGYISCQGDGRPKNRVGHNLTNIRHILDGVSGPPGSCETWSGFDVFSGYLLFDAWIANTDRHAMNWAVLIQRESRALAASFDHGSALASGSSDDDLVGADPLAFSRRGMASRFEDGRSVSLVELAQESIALAGDRAGQWIERLEAVTDGAVDRILADVPGLSVERRSFLNDILSENRRRLVS